MGILDLNWTIRTWEAWNKEIRACIVDGEKVDDELGDLHSSKVFFPLGAGVSSRDDIR